MDTKLLRWESHVHKGFAVNHVQFVIHFVEAPVRELEVKGYGSRFVIYVLQKERFGVVSYAPGMKPVVDELRNLESMEQMMKVLTEKHPVQKKQLMVFDRETVHDYKNARILRKEDYPFYEAFFRQCNPDTDTTGWLREYFEEKAEKEYFAGYFSDGALASVSDAPDMPHMEDRIQHTGIETLPSERRKGYAKCTCALATHHLLERGICPQWECDYSNTASKLLAKAIGYREYGTAYIVEA